MPGTPTPKYAIPTLDGTTLARDIDTEVNAGLLAIDSKMVGYSAGPLGSRPTSTPGSPGIAGRIYRATDDGKSVYYIDNGTGWDRLARVIDVVSATWEPGNIFNGTSVGISVSVPGAQAGDLILTSHTAITLQGLILTAQYTAPVSSNVAVTLANLSGGSLTVPSGTLTVMVLRP